MNSIADSIIKIQDTIRQCERKAGRQPGEVKLMAVSKFHPAASVLAAARCGIDLFGENRLQEAAEKFPAVFAAHPKIKLHMIGTLQRNKVKALVELVSCIESVDRVELIEEIEKQCKKLGKTMKIFFELHTGEESKAGFTSLEELDAAVEYACQCPHVIPSGFMTMAPFTEDRKRIQASFAALARGAEYIRDRYPDLPLTELSMGMSNDYQLAIAEGSTIVRVGTSIFGQRNSL